MIRDDYRVRGRGGRSLNTLEGSLQNLEAFFGACRALATTSDRITSCERERLDAGAARATVNKELAALRRAFNLAVKARRLPPSARPFISTPDPHNARSGFFEESDFRAVLAELPEPMRPAFQFAYLTGWRVPSEVMTLTWAQVDFAAGVLRLARSGYPLGVPSEREPDSGVPRWVAGGLQAGGNRQARRTRDGHPPATLRSHTP